MQAIKLDREKDSEYSVFPESQEREKARARKTRRNPKIIVHYIVQDATR